MKEKTFINLVKNRFKICEAVLNKKSSEYSREDDKLYNFKRASEMVGSPVGYSKYLCYPEDALQGMFVKHLVSVMDMIDDLPNLPNFLMMREKITDCINYLVLLEGLFMERIDPEDDLEFGISGNISQGENDDDKVIDSVEDRIEREKFNKTWEDALRCPGRQ